MDSIFAFVPGGLLLLAGLSKLFQLAWFISRVKDYQMLPARTVGPTAVLIVCAEVAVGASLVMGWLTQWSALAGILLFVVFGVGMAVNLFRKRFDLDCGCVKRGQLVSWTAVWRNVAMVGLLSLRFRPAGVGDALVISVASTLIGLWALSLAMDALSQKRRPHPATAG